MINHKTQTPKTHPFPNHQDSSFAVGFNEPPRLRPSGTEASGALGDEETCTRAQELHSTGQAGYLALMDGGVSIVTVKVRLVVLICFVSFAF